MSNPGVEQPDEILVVEAILGNLYAFNELASRYRAAVVRTAQAIVGREFAEDVAQDALLLAFKALPSIDEPTKFAAWLSAITRHRAMRFGKRENQLRSRSVTLDEMLLEKVEALSQPLPEQSGNEELRRALETVPDEYSMVLKLRFLDEMPLKRIAAFLGAPLSTVKGRVHQGKKLLRRELEAAAK
jgi:RNA polymerase sigma-70 factor (ECF subfamily)